MKVLKLLSMMFILILGFTACGSATAYEAEEPTAGVYDNAYEPPPEPQPTPSAPAPEDIPEPEEPYPTPENNTEAPTPNPTSLTVTINNTPTHFQAYEILGRHYIAIGDLSQALEYTRVRFSFWENQPSDRDRYLISGISTYTFNDRIHVNLTEIAPRVGFNVLSQHGNEISICTDEPYISEAYFEAIVEFFITNYPHIFTREMVWENLGEGIGYWRAGTYRIFDFYGGRPFIEVVFHDAGSWQQMSYSFIGGTYQRAIGLPPSWELYQCPEGRLVWICFYGYSYFVFADGAEHIPADIDEALLVPRRALLSLHRRVSDEVNQRLWPALALCTDSIMVDGNLPSAAVDVVVSFIMGLSGIQSIDEIKASLIHDNLIAVTVTNTHGFTDYYWVTLHIVDGNYEVYSYVWGFHWHY